jgi:transposase InsO family protein
LGLSTGPVPARLVGELKEGLLKLIDDAVDQGWAHQRACGVLGISDVRVHRWRRRLREVGTLVDRAPGGNAVHRLLDWEVAAILELIEQWGEIDRSHRKLAHRGSYVDKVFVAPSTLRRVAEKHQVSLPEPARRQPVVHAPWPEWVRWAPNSIWIWDATHFTRARRSVFAIVDVVSRYWVELHVSAEESSTEVQLLFADALEAEGLLERLTPERLDLDVDDPRRPILLAWSDNGPQMTSGSTREFMALVAIWQYHGRPHTPTDQAHIESFFGHIKGEWPHLNTIINPLVLEAELRRVRMEYNTVRLHAGVGYVTPDDEHHGRGPAIRRAREKGLRDARQARIDQNRKTNDDRPEDRS